MLKRDSFGLKENDFLGRVLKTERKKQRAHPTAAVPSDGSLPRECAKWSVGGFRRSRLLRHVGAVEMASDGTARDVDGTARRALGEPRVVDVLLDAPPLLFRKPRPHPIHDRLPLLLGEEDEDVVFLGVIDVADERVLYGTVGRREERADRCASIGREASDSTVRELRRVARHLCEREYERTLQLDRRLGRRIGHRGAIKVGEHGGGVGVVARVLGQHATRLIPAVDEERVVMAVFVFHGQIATAEGHVRVSDLHQNLLCSWLK